MTKHELKQISYLQREIQRDMSRLVDMKIAIKQKDTPSEMQELIARREKLIQSKLLKLEKLKLEIETFLNSVEDSLVRQVLYYRYEKCMTWRQVSFAVGCRCTEESVRKIAERYLERNST